MGSSFKRNRIINGNAQVAQRGTSFTNVSSGSLTNQYTLDRWWGYRSTYASNLSISQQAGFGGSQYCLRFGRANGDTSTATIDVGQIIESVNMVDLQGQIVTLSFYARTSPSGYSGGALSVVISSGTTADQGLATLISGWAGATTPLNTTQTLTTTATKYSFTATVPANSLELAIQFLYTPTGTAGSTDYIEITNVQLEVGSVATPYERQIYSDQLAQCQRYYAVSNNLSPKGAASGSIAGLAAANNSIGTFWQYPVQMRATPTISIWQNGTQNRARVTATGSVVTITTLTSASGSCYSSSSIIYDSGGIPFTAGTSYDFDLIATAEL